MPNLGGIVRELKAQRDRAQRDLERARCRSHSLGQPGKRERKIESSSGRQKTQAYVGGCSQENRRGSACSLGKMEEKQAAQVKGKNARTNYGMCPPGRFRRDLPWGKKTPSRLRRHRWHWKVAAVSESGEAATLRNILPEHSRSAGTGPMKCRPLSSSILNSSAAMFPLSSEQHSSGLDQ